MSNNITINMQLTTQEATALARVLRGMTFNSQPKPGTAKPGGVVYTAHIVPVLTDHQVTALQGVIDSFSPFFTG